MLKAQAAFAGISVKDLASAKEFYSNKLGLKLTDDQMGLNYELPGGGGLYIYDKPDHQPATYTCLNFVVEDIDTAVDDLAAVGVKTEGFDGLPVPPDERGILRGLKANMGPDITWFKDPAGNIISILQDK